MLADPVHRRAGAENGLECHWLKTMTVQRDLHYLLRYQHYEYWLECDRYPETAASLSQAEAAAVLMAETRRRHDHSASSWPGRCHRHEDLVFVSSQWIQHRTLRI